MICRSTVPPPPPQNAAGVDTGTLNINPFELAARQNAQQQTADGQTAQGAEDAGGTPSSKEAIPFFQPNPQCKKPEFFAYYNHFKKMADELDTNVDFLMAQSSRESKWGKSEAAKGKNLFGVNRADNDPRIYRGSDGKLHGTNEVYSSYEEGIQKWMDKWGKYVKGAKTLDQYTDGLLNNGEKQYNPYKERYIRDLNDSYKSILKRKKDCGIPD